MAEAVRILYFTQAGEELARKLQDKISGGRFGQGQWPSCEIASGRGKGRLHAWTGENFSQGKILVYIGACGIAVRAIAPFVASKVSDPAVIVIDETGRHVIPILSGHIGGANRWAVYLAGLLGGGSEAVLTTATDVNDLPAIDEFAVVNGLIIDDMPRAKAFSAELLREAYAAAHSEAADTGQTVVPEGNVEGHDSEAAGRSCEQGERAEAYDANAARQADMHEKIPEVQEPGIRRAVEEKKANILLSHLLIPETYSKWIALDTKCKKGSPTSPVCVISPEIRKSPEPLCLIPKMLVLGVGCRRGREPEELIRFAGMVLEEHALRSEAVCAVASIDIKREEPAINRLAQNLNVPFRTFDAEQLREIPGRFHESEFVRKTTGVGNVCERAAMAAGAEDILVPKTAENGMTIAVGICRADIRI